MYSLHINYRMLQTVCVCITFSIKIILIRACSAVLLAVVGLPTLPHVNPSIVPAADVSEVIHVDENLRPQMIRQQVQLGLHLVLVDDCVVFVIFDNIVAVATEVPFAFL